MNARRGGLGHLGAENFLHGRIEARGEQLRYTVLRHPKFFDNFIELAGVVVISLFVGQSSVGLAHERGDHPKAVNLRFHLRRPFFSGLSRKLRKQLFECIIRIRRLGRIVKNVHRFFDKNKPLPERGKLPRCDDDMPSVLTSEWMVSVACGKIKPSTTGRVETHPDVGHPINAPDIKDILIDGSSPDIGRDGLRKDLALPAEAGGWAEVHRAIKAAKLGVRRPHPRLTAWDPGGRLPTVSVAGEIRCDDLPETSLVPDGENSY